MGEKFEGDPADTSAGQFMFMWIGGLACADPGVRTPIRINRNFSIFCLPPAPAEIQNWTSHMTLALPFPNPASGTTRVRGPALHYMSILELVMEVITPTNTEGVRAR